MWGSKVNEVFEVYNFDPHTHPVKNGISVSDNNAKANLYLNGSWLVV
jgi:hypothetical protein